MTSPFTCITCYVKFTSLEIQREHYKSDWHRYNLKRKVTEHPPVTAEEFRKRVIAQQSINVPVEIKQNLSCKICRKNFNSKNQYENHLASKKHKDKSGNDNKELSHAMKESNDDSENSKNKAVTSSESPTNINGVETDSDIESVDSNEWIEDTENPVQKNNCLFCNHHSRSLVSNLKHMTIAHSFFVPDVEYCIDLKGLLTYLGEKIFAGYMCIWCNDSGRIFHSVEAVRTHMLDKGHCKMLHEGEGLMEYTEFYDYSSSYPDVENGDPDAEVKVPELDDSNYQLVLPSGNIIGHRSLMRYYKQNLNPNGAVALSKNDKLRKILLEYRALGWTGTKKEIVQRKIKDIKYMHMVQNKYSTQLQFKANKLQKHFRQQINF